MPPLPNPEVGSIGQLRQSGQGESVFATTIGKMGRRTAKSLFCPRYDALRRNAWLDAPRPSAM